MASAYKHFDKYSYHHGYDEIARHILRVRPSHVEVSYNSMSLSVRIQIYEDNFLYQTIHLSEFEYRELCEYLAYQYGYYLEKEPPPAPFNANFSMEAYTIQGTTGCTTQTQPLTPSSLAESIRILEQENPVTVPKKQEKIKSEVFHKLYHHRRLR